MRADRKEHVVKMLIVLGLVLVFAQTGVMQIPRNFTAFDLRWIEERCAA